MLAVAQVVFSFVALLGVIMASQILKVQQADWSHSRLHAILAVVGAVLVIAAYLKGDARVVTNILLVVAIAGASFYLAHLHAKGQAQPAGLVFGHGGLAVVCYLLLAYYVLGKGPALYGRRG